MIISATPDVRSDIIRVGTCVRKPPVILAAYLKSLASQIIPPNCRVDYHFIADQAEPESLGLLKEFVQKYGGVVEEATGETAPDFDDNHPVTHQWSASAMSRVGQMKDRIIEKAVTDNVIALWFCDADLVCDDHTLRSLWYTNQPISHAVFWTRWQNDPTLPVVPQVWLLHPYSLQGRGYVDEPAFRRQLLTRQLTRVWGGGACTLIRREALREVRYAYIPGVSQEGMMAGEDRHFCIRAESQHIPMFADPWPHIFHVYHPDQIPEIPTREEQLTRLRGEVKWLSLSMKLLEPAQTGPSTFISIPAINVRARVGVGDILPDLEAQCLAHLDGKTFTATIHYPVGYVVASLRGRRRLVEVTVVDYKNNDPMPVLEYEMPYGVDLMTYTGRQLESLHG